MPDLLAQIENSDPPAIQDDVIKSSVLGRRPGGVHVFLRLQRTKIVTAVYNSEHDVRFELVRDIQRPLDEQLYRRVLSQVMEQGEMLEIGQREG